MGMIIAKIVRNVSFKEVIHMAIDKDMLIGDLIQVLSLIHI